MVITSVAILKVAWMSATMHSSQTQQHQTHAQQHVKKMDSLLQHCTTEQSVLAPVSRDVLPSSWMTHFAAYHANLTR